MPCIDDDGRGARSQVSSFSFGCAHERATAPVAHPVENARFSQDSRFAMDNVAEPMMEPEIIQLNVQRAGMEKISLRAELTTTSGAHRLVIVWPVGSEERHFDGSNYYECLRAFRRVIEPDGFRVLCQGARPNVCPSGMARDGGAWKSYVFTLGQPAFTKDLVGTFDPVEDIASVGTVEEQDEFMRRHWEEFEKRI